MFINIALSQHAKSTTNKRQVTELEEMREARRDEACTTSMYLHEDTLIVLVSTPKSFDTVQDTDRLAVGTTLILCVTLPLTKGLSSSCVAEDSKKKKCVTAAAPRGFDATRPYWTTRGGCWIDEQTKPGQDARSSFGIKSVVSQESCRHKDKLPTPFLLC